MAAHGIRAAEEASKAQRLNLDGGGQIRVDIRWYFTMRRSGGSAGVIRQVRAHAAGSRAERATGFEADFDMLELACLDASTGGSMSTRISVMLAVDDATRAAEWYKLALGATELWSVGSVIGLAIDDAPFFLHEPTAGFVSPTERTTARVEVFVDEPDRFIHRAIEAGADGSADPVRDHQTPWGVHRQGGFRDPFGHVWLVGDTSPLRRQVTRADDGA